MNDNYIATKEDSKYFKELFQEIFKKEFVREINK